MKTLPKTVLLIIATAFLTSCAKDDSPSSDDNSGGSPATDEDFVMGVTNDWEDEEDEFHTFRFENTDTLGGFAGQEISSGNYLLGNTRGFDFSFTLITQFSPYETIKYTGTFTDTTPNHKRLLLFDPDSNALYLRPQQ